MKRYDGIDIIKIIAILFVPSLHFFLNYNFFTQPMVSYGKIIQIYIRLVSFNCIGLFIMSSGYLQCHKTPTKSYFKKIIRYVIIYICFSVITAIVVHGRINIVKNSLYYIFNFPAYFWYMSFFFGFYLLMPYLNNIINRINKKRDFGILILILTLVISLPDFVNQFPPLFGKDKIVRLPDWWIGFFPVLYYVLGAYFKKFQPKVSKKLLTPLLLAPLAISVAVFFCFKGNVITWLGGGYGNTLAVFMTCSIFALFYNMRINNWIAGKITSYVSSLTLETYLGLIVSDTLIFKIITSQFSNMLNPYTFKLYFIEFPLSFLISFTIAIIFNLLYRMAEKGVKVSKLLINRNN